ncbi:MAG: Ig-like domain-containing protein, partial [Solirubrobacterales bacterium]
ALTDGDYSFRVRATDAAANPDPSPATEDFTVSTTLPDTVIDSAPHGSTSDPTPSFTFHSTKPGSTFACSLDQGTADYQPCTSPFTQSPALTDGDYTFRVRATDAATNPDPSPATEDFTVDTAAPDPPVLTATAPSSPANDNNPKVKGTVGGGNASQVSIYTNGACTGSLAATGTVTELTGSGITVSGLPDDSTTQLSAKVTNLSNNESGCSNSITYVEDSTAPNTAITSAPPASTGSTDASFAFGSTEPGSFECKLDDDTFQSCSSPKKYSGLAAGSHTFQVRSTDAAGNTDPTPASHAWTIAPQVLGQSAQSPSFQVKKKLKRVRRKVVVVTVNCPEGTCTVERSRAKLKLKGKRKSVKVRIKGPSVISAGESARLKAVFSKATHHRLSKVGRGRLHLKLLVTSTNGTQAELSQSIKLTGIRR